VQRQIPQSKEQLLARLAPAGQEHVLAYWDQLSPAEQQGLAEQLAHVDCQQLAWLFNHLTCSEAWADLARRAGPPESYRLCQQGSPPPTALAARAVGRRALDQGHLGVLLVAGGQGTRLGFEHPKGMFPIGPVSGHSLFQILLEKVLARGRQHGVAIPLYLMTSPATHQETMAYLAEHDYFGLCREDVHIFCQGTMPAVDARNGRLLLAARDSLSLSPDGHGGMLAALVESGGLADMQRRGLQQVFYLQVDNPLVPLCDPEVIGYHLQADSELTTLVIRKRHSRDKLGNVVLIDGQLRIIEYSDLNPLPDEIVGGVDGRGEPIFWAGNTGFHVFNVAFLARAAASGDSLPFHSALKQVPYLDDDGRLIDPAEPNAVKFERFIFDLLPLARHGIVVEADQEDAFAPVKNAAGEPLDTPQSVRGQMISVHQRWLRAAGGQVADEVAVEIGPLFAQDQEQAQARFVPPPVVTSATYFG
jgi:UDP-N-acetylglucosamine/UDP-N-acetylgalactosamine diphosphorylase